MPQDEPKPRIYWPCLNDDHEFCRRQIPGEQKCSCECHNKKPEGKESTQ